MASKISFLGTVRVEADFSIRAFFNPEDLVKACDENNIERISALISKARENINETYQNDRTVLMYISCSGFSRAIEALLEGLEDVAVKEIVNAKDEYGRTGLMYAADKGYYAVVDLLIRAGADVNITDKEDRTALMYAVLNGDFSTVELLLGARATVNAKNNRGQTALMYAAFNEFIDILIVLIKAGADLDVTNLAGNSALKLAVMENKVDVVKVLMEAGAKGAFMIEDRDSIGVLVPIGNNSTDRSSRIAPIDTARDVLIPGYSGMSLDNVVESLIRAGTNDVVNAALMQACIEGKLGMVELLTRRAGANVNVVDSRYRY